MKHVILQNLIAGILLNLSWAAEPPTDDEIRHYMMLLVEIDQLNDPDYTPSEDSSDDDGADIARDYSMRNRKRRAVQPPAEEDVPVAKRPKIVLDGIPFPDAIYQELIQYTIGQDAAMRSLSIFIHAHLINVRINESRDKLETPPTRAMEKSNILMVGPTGCGKTSTLEVLAKYLGTPLVVGNATEWTSQGYVGRKWQDIFEDLWSTAQLHARKNGARPTQSEIKKVAEKSIVFIDEIDKLCPGLDGEELDVINRVQQELLPVIQGTRVRLESGIEIDTSGILFVTGGAFADLTTGKKKIDKITAHDLHAYGMLPELAGRLANVVQFGPLEKSHLIDIIIKSKHSFMAQFIYKFKVAYGIDLSFDSGAIEHIADMASKQLTGARAINIMINKIMEDVLFKLAEYMDKPLVITKEMSETSLKSFVPPKKEESRPPLSMYS